MNNNLFSKLFIILSVVFTAVSCNKDKIDDGINPQNKALAGTMWTLTDWDHSIGDDYIGIHNYTIDIYFYSYTEGLVYYGKKDYYTDTEGSSYRAVAHFNFNVDGGYIDIDYITPEIPEAYFKDFTLMGDRILSDGFEFHKEDISPDNNSWLNSLHGKTGECFWYHDLQSTLYISGDGKMSDYSSPNSTPWARRTFNSLEVSEGVTSIGNNAFAFISLAQVDLPTKSLNRIGDNAFSGSCISKIYLGDNITEIGNNAFNGCTYLSKIYMPQNIERIGDFAFSECKDANLSGTKALKEIGKFAFSGCTVNAFTDSEVLEAVRECAFTNLNVKQLVLPNTIKALEHLAFSGNITEIRIGSGLSEVTGTPFYPASIGKIYVNITKPLPLSRSLLDPAYGWTLYVPEGCKSAYSSASYWKDFKLINEDSSLGNGEDIPGDGDNPGDDDDTDYVWGDNSGITSIPETYTNGGKTYKWIRVESPTMPTYYIMQTELDANSHFRIGDDWDIGILNANGDRGVIKTEMRRFLETIKEVTGIEMRNPTREEWEYAASGGNKSQGFIYSGSNNIDDVAWYEENSNNRIQGFALKQPNELGLYDMSGNYAELTNDRYVDYANVEGYMYGGCYKDDASDCKITSCKEGTESGKIPGSNLKEKNAFDASYITVRLVFTAPY